MLFAQQLPDDCNDAMLAILFQQFSGFKEVRMVPGKKGLAFVEFLDETSAGLALKGHRRRSVYNRKGPRYIRES